MSSPNTRRDEKISSSDLYVTPQEAMQAILPYVRKDVEKLYNKLPNQDLPLVLDPCSGLGDMIKFFNDNLAIYPLANEKFLCKNHVKVLYAPEYQGDFLSDDSSVAAQKGCIDMILANPPYNQATEFVLKGFEYAPIQWHFLRLSFLEGQKRFETLFNYGKLSDVYIFTYRVSCQKGYDREDTANSVCYAWFRFDNNYCGEPRLHWLTKPNLQENK